MPAVLKPARTGVVVRSGSARQVSSRPGPLGAARRLSEPLLREAPSRRAQLVSAASRSATSVRVQRDFSPEDDNSGHVALVGRQSSRQAVPQRAPLRGPAATGSQMRARLLPRSSPHSQDARQLAEVKPERSAACDEEVAEQRPTTPQRRGAAVLVSRARRDHSHASHAEAQSQSSPRSALREDQGHGGSDGGSGPGRLAARVIRAHGDNLRGAHGDVPRAVVSSRRDSRDSFVNARRSIDSPAAEEHRAVSRRVQSPRGAFHQEEPSRQVRARERQVAVPAPRAELTGRGMRRPANTSADLPRQQSQQLSQDESPDVPPPSLRVTAARDSAGRGRAVVLSRSSANEARREKDLRQKLDDFQQMSDDLDMKAEQLQKESDDLTLRISDQETAESDLLQEKAQLRTQKDQMKSEEKELKHDQEEFERQMQEMKLKEEKLNSEAVALKQRMEDMTKRQEDQEKRELALKGQKENLSKHSEELTKRQDNLRSQRDELRRKSEALKDTGQEPAARQASVGTSVTRLQKNDRDHGPASARRRAAKEEPEDPEPPAKQPRREASAVQHTASAATTAVRSSAAAALKVTSSGGAGGGSTGRGAAGVAVSASGSAALAPAAGRKRKAEASVEQALPEAEEAGIEEEEEEEEWFEGEEEEWYEGEEEEWLEGEEEEFLEGGEEELWEGGEEEYFEGEEEECVDEAEEAEEAEEACPKEASKEEKSVKPKQEIVETAEKHEKGDSNDHWEMRSRSRSRERTRGASGQVAPEASKDNELAHHEEGETEKERRRQDHIERRRAEVQATGSPGTRAAASERRQRPDEMAPADADQGQAAEKRRRHTAASFSHPSTHDSRRERLEPAAGGRDRRSAVDREPLSSRADREEHGTRMRRAPSPQEPPRAAPRRSGGGNALQAGRMMRGPRWSGTAHMDRGH